MLVTRVEDLALSPALLQRLWSGSASDVVGRARGELDPVASALLLLAFDAGVVPAHTSLEPSRDVAPLLGGLERLVGLGLLQASPHNPDALALPPQAQVAVRARLEHLWGGALAKARQGLGAKAAPAALPTHPEAPMRRWLRDLALFVAHRGVRLTQAGQLHLGDLRLHEKARPLPSRAILDDSLPLALGSNTFWTTGERLILADALDLLDLAPPDLAAEVLRAWAEGHIPKLYHGSITHLSGLLGAYLDPLKHFFDALPERDPRAAQRELAKAALPAVLSSEPCAHLLQGARGLDMKAAPSTFLLKHRHLRLGWLNWALGLPRGVWLSKQTLVDAAWASIALENLRRPALVARADGPPAHLFAAATWLFAPLRRRLEDELLPWLESLLSPWGLLARDGDRVALHPHAPQTPWPLSAKEHTQDQTWCLTPNPSAQPPPPRPPLDGRIVIQPNGEAMVPPDAPLQTQVHLACGARPIQLDRVSVFSLDRRSLMRLTDSGLDPRAWGEALSTMLGAPLPGPVTELLEDVARRQGELTLSPTGGVLVAQDEVRMSELLSYAKLARHVLLRPAPTVAILRAGCDLAALLEELGERGFSGVILEEPTLTPAK
jgi:hypothetical protein